MVVRGNGASLMGTVQSMLVNDVTVQRSRKRFALGLTVVGFLALLVREHFVLASVPDNPIRGDIAQYVNYALNLIYNGTFSNIDPSTKALVPDAYRGPGFPAFLAFCMMLAGEGGGWYSLALQFNVLLGVGTCILLALLIRPWVGVGWAICAASLLALWPHHVAATGVLLLEVVFGFFLLLSALLAATHMRNGRWSYAVASGLALGFSWLINPLAISLLPVFAFILWMGVGRKGVLWLLVGAFILIGPWSLRNSALPTDQAGAGRAALNIAQGSWPNYHAAHLAVMRGGSIAVPETAAMEEMGREASLLSSAPIVGLRAMRARMARNPMHYARWYFLEKPWLLWDWDIRIGAGDVYFHRYLLSPPMERYPLLRAVKSVYKASNFALFGLALTFAVGVGVFVIRRKSASLDPALVLVAGMFFCLTVVHVIFQAEPRYANAYRWVQIALACGALALVARWVSEWIAAVVPGKSVLPSGAGSAVVNDGADGVKR